MFVDLFAPASNNTLNFNSNMVFFDQNLKIIDNMVVKGV